MAKITANLACPEADRLVGPLSRHTYGWMFGRFSAVRAALLAQGAEPALIAPAPPVEQDPTVKVMGRAAAAGAIKALGRGRGGDGSTGPRGGGGPRAMAEAGAGAHEVCLEHDHGR